MDAFAERDRRAGTGCLVSAGFLLLLVVTPVLILVFRYRVQSAWHALDWSSLRSFVTSVVGLFARSEGSWIEGAFAVLFFAFLFLLWQWVVFLWRRPLLVSPRRLWALSSGYFIVFIVLCLYAGFVEWPRLRGAQSDYDLADAIVFGFILCMISACFLSITLQLWLSTPPSEKPSEQAKH